MLYNIFPLLPFFIGYICLFFAPFPYEWVYLKRLDESRYGWPKDLKEAMNINKEQLTWLLLGLKVIKNPNKKRYKDLY